ncbi:Ppx/GppA family phosphatase [Lactobacillus amylovorus]|uniref:Ppx/GppA family phosphatase n=1 Tax=Lactobacillus amylovorus TaxID=1604 RepID=UPI0022E986C5|nr:Ppx/GppA family phosphatase [Lactobacillus amylovorus]MDB6250700.1 exopolyphosphatase [Lactobacillus amylovorus]MDD7406517.1 Ppx/GppA family phosphatase [Lactobacillus amylovorus]MDY2786100.1 Ppx/GppA family phosphatase [Lactobacillus amylovorus]
MTNTNLVVIDLGSNSVRMQISQIDDYGGYTVMGYFREYVRLSENMGKEMTLKEEPMNRTIQALKDFKTRYTQYDNVVVKAVATAAVRGAKNQAEFLKRVKDEVGLDLQVISGSTEAYLDYIGVVNTLPVRNGIIMDCGGASTELIWVQNGACKERVSIPVGSVVLSQNYNLADTISASDLYSAMNAAGQKISTVRWLGQVHNLPLIALGGSNRTIAKIHRREVTDEVDELPDIHGMHLPPHYIFNLVGKLIAMNKDERMKIPGLAKNRADVIVGGLIPISLVLRNLQISEVIFSNCGLRDGILFEYLRQSRKE